MITSKVIGSNIKRLRLLHHETQLELAEYLGYSVSAIANYEKGYRLPSLETFILLALHYQATIEDFIQE